MEQFNGRVILFLDNLETIQVPTPSRSRTKPLRHGCKPPETHKDLILLCTSRWEFPDWDGEHLLLSHANYGDFLQMAQALALRGQFKMFLDSAQNGFAVYERAGRQQPRTGIFRRRHPGPWKRKEERCLP